MSSPSPFIAKKHNRSIAFVNYKGGVGKTTTTLLVGRYLAAAGHKVLLVDIDPQCSLSLALGIDASSLDVGGKDIYELMHPSGWGELKTRDFASYVTKMPTKGIDLLRGSFSVDELDLEIAKSIPLDADRREIELFLYCRQVINGYSNYDYVLIDCPPNKMYLTQAMLRSSKFFIPITIPDRLSTYGMPRLLRWIDRMPKDERPDMLGYILNDLNRHGGGMTDEQSKNSARVRTDVGNLLTAREKSILGSSPELGVLPHLDVIPKVVAGDADIADLKIKRSGQPTPHDCLEAIIDAIISRAASY